MSEKTKSQRIKIQIETIKRLCQEDDVNNYGSIQGMLYLLEKEIEPIITVMDFLNKKSCETKIIVQKMDCV